MNSAIERLILGIDGSWALDVVAKATLVIAGGLCAARLARGKRAAFRHALMAAAFGFLLLLPIVSAIAPPHPIAMRAAGARPLAAALGQNAPAASAFQPSGGVAARRAPLWAMGFAAWISGAVLFLIHGSLGVRQVLRLRRSGLPWAEGQALAGKLAGGYGVRRRVAVLLHEHLAGPMTCGLARPAIVFPSDARGWDPAEIERALVHELEHVARWDWATLCAARVACALYWFHPLVWIAWRRLHLEAERACDDAVLQRAEPTAYADQLVAVARRLSGAARPPLPAMASRSDLSSRVRAVLDGDQPRGRAGAFCVAGAATAAALLVLAVSPLRIVAAPQTSGAAGPVRLRVDVKLVVTQVKVTFPNGNTVEGLSAGDFEITENGVPQPIRFFEFQRLAEPNSGYYQVGYYPANTRADGQFRKIHVAVKNASSAKVEFREGYYMNETVGFAQTSAAPSAKEPASPPPFDRPPVLIFKREPEYTEEARQARYQGTVLLQVEIEDSGRVSRVQVIHSLGLGLDEKAIEAVKQWRFRPATKDGKPITFMAQLEVNFRLL